MKRIIFMKKFFLVFSLILLCFNTSCSAMHDASLSSSKKRKLRKKRSFNELVHKEYIGMVVLHKLYSTKNEPTPIPLEVWYPSDAVGDGILRHETKEYPASIYIFF